MPKPLDSRMRAIAETENARAMAETRKRADRKRYRDITKRAQTSPVIAGDTTRNADSRKRKLSDKLAKHETDTTYVVSDTRIYQDARLVAIERKRGGIPLMRDSKGNVDESETLALIRLWRNHLASNPRREG